MPDAEIETGPGVESQLIGAEAGDDLVPWMRQFARGELVCSRFESSRSAMPEIPQWGSSRPAER